MTEIKTDKDWEDLYECLYIFTHKLLKSKRWYKKLDSHSFIKGKQVHDYVLAGVEEYYLNEEKYNPKKGSLENYIKFNIIRNLVRQDAVSLENKTNLDIYKKSASLETDELDSSYVESLFPFVENYFGDEIDYDIITNHINTEIAGDTIVEDIFLGIISDLKRSKIIEEFGMSASEYDNGMRRLKTVLKNTANKFSLKQQTI
ncbi:hypothetical protein ACFSUS_28605 [Spirosoma soli]|uniref:Sigma-70 family RNA polymerase sigma factor n=1 Tax=Spirosoma soli TaxID=1770529 RepID=A0ABW5MGC4_9BACT